MISGVDRTSYNGWDHSQLMDLQFNHDRWMRIRRIRWSYTSSSSYDEIASWPSVRDLTVIEERRWFVKRRLIATVDRDESLNRMVTPLFCSLNSVLRDGRTCPVDFCQIRFVQTIISRAVWFPTFLMHFRIHWMLEIKGWFKEEEEFTSWTSIFVFGNSEWKAMHQAINRIISKANLG